MSDERKESFETEVSDSESQAKRARKIKPFPASTFEDALLIATKIQEVAGAAGKVRRITLFDELQRSPDSGGSRQLVTNSSRYKLTTGSYGAEFLELTPEGRTAVDPEVTPNDRLRVNFRLAIENIEPFKKLYEAFCNAKLPSQSVMKDKLVELDVEKEDADEGVDTFIANAKYIGLIRTMSGVERLLSVDHASDENAKQSVASGVASPVLPRVATPLNASTDGAKEWDKICFYISPIGEEGSEERKHADMVLGSLVEPAVNKIGLKVVRADKISESGMITSQIIEHLKLSKLVVADLSYLNPNVFYEVALRHATRLSMVQLIRKKDRIPFDVGQVRTIVIDTTDIFTLVPKIDVYMSEIATHARSAIDNPDLVGNPISVFFPAFYDMHK